MAIVSLASFEGLSGLRDYKSNQKLVVNQRIVCFFLRKRYRERFRTVEAQMMAARQKEQRFLLGSKWPAAIICFTAKRLRRKETQRIFLI
jgi:hypothetical protein